MTTISATIIKHSISPEGITLGSVQMRYPRFIHAELMTHRVLSRNARSSRAVPVETMLREIETDPVVPLFWGANQKGMQAGAECDALISQSWRDDCSPHDTLTNVEAWLQARDYAVGMARAFMQAGYHKQVINRLLEPFMHIDVLVTATEWANFLALRDHHMAEPHIAVLARAVKAAFAESTPRLLKKGQWHLPYMSDAEVQAMGCIDTAIKVSVARCARISYKPFDGNADVASEIARHDQLVGAAPMHASPAEHQATPDMTVGPHGSVPVVWNQPELHGNLRGWCQYRKLLPGENISA